MPGCCAIGCNNSNKKGFLMKHFPKDPQRRKLWEIKVGRNQWTATDASCLCEVHFESDMWENTREDETKRLKISAVPTLFSFDTVGAGEKSSVSNQPGQEADASVGTPEQSASMVLLLLASQASVSNIFDTQISSTPPQEMGALETQDIEEAETQDAENEVLRDHTYSIKMTAWHKNVIELNEQLDTVTSRNVFAHLQDHSYCAAQILS